MIATGPVMGMEGSLVQLPAERVHDLAGRVRGTVLHPGDDGWGEAVDLWNGMVAKEPALVVRPRGAEDVAEVVRFAHAHRLMLGVKGGGHNIAGTAVPHRGLLLDMAQLNTVEVDPEARLAHVGAGCRLGDVDRATQVHGLATPLGFISDTGVAGLTLGGGLGYLTRRFGWTVDNLEEVRIVTADGHVRTASPTDDHSSMLLAQIATSINNEGCRGTPIYDHFHKVGNRRRRPPFCGPASPSGSASVPRCSASPLRQIPALSLNA